MAPQETEAGRAITSFDGWIEGMQELMAHANDPVSRVTGALEVVDRLMAGRDHLDLDQFGPGASSYARHLIHRDPEDRFCLLVLVWKPGQGTPIHDHSGAWGVYGVLKNRMRFVNYTVDPSGEEGKLLLSSSTVASAGSATTVLPPHCDVHRMENACSEEISMTAHCYGKEIRNFNIYQLSGARRPGEVSYDTER